MLGTVVNALAIIMGGLVGLLFSRGIPERYKETILGGISLAVILIGLKNALVTDRLMIVIFSILFGAVLGEALKIEAMLERLGKYIEKKVTQNSSSNNLLAKGFVTSSLLFCVGSMAIVGSLESGLTGNHQTLFAKSILDGVTSILFASTMGAGVLLSSVAVFLYQGTITLTAVYMKPFLVTETIEQMTAVGGLLIVAIGMNMLKITSIRVGNLLPAIAMPLVYFMIMQLF